MKTKNIIIYIVACLIIIAGVAVWHSKGFKTELQYSSRFQITLDNHTGVKKSDVENIANDVLGNTKHLVQEVGIFGNAVNVVSEEMSEEQKKSIVEKFNEKYEDSELKAEDVEIKYIPFTRIKDIIKNYIIPGICTFIIVLIYFLIMYRKIGLREVILKTLFAPLLSELLMFSLIAILRIPFGRIAIALGVGLYVAVIAILACIFEDKRNKYTNSEEKNRKED